jgi:GNAT superfamily N-acetyltransferase
MNPVRVARRVRADEWEAARELRLAALQDEVAHLAFLESYESAAGRSDGFWRTRATSAATSDTVAQFVMTDAEGWVGTATVMVHPPGTRDYFGRIRLAPAAIIVAVYVRPEVRGSGAIEALLDAASGFAGEQGLAEITLDVHEDNLRAQAAYRRCGFTPTGESFVGPNGREIEFRRAV